MRIKEYIQDKFSGDEVQKASFINNLINQDILSMQLLNKLVPSDIYLPFTSYSMSPTMVIHILNEILLLNYKFIVEFGSGLSTFFIAKMLSENNITADFFSVDHDIEWQNYLRKLLVNEGIEENVKLISSNLESAPGMTGQKCSWYSKNTLKYELPDQIDLAIVDGPPVASGTFSRYHAMPFIANRFSEHYSLFLDDTFRDGEKQIIRRWERELRVTPQKFVRYAVFSTNTKISTIPLSLSYDYKYRESLKCSAE